MRNFIIAFDDQKYEVIYMYDQFGNEIDDPTLAEAVIIKWSEEDIRSHPVAGKVWTLQ